MAACVTDEIIIAYTQIHNGQCQNKQTNKQTNNIILAVCVLGSYLLIKHLMLTHLTKNYNNNKKNFLKTQNV